MEYIQKKECIPLKYYVGDNQLVGLLLECRNLKTNEIYYV